MFCLSYIWIQPHKRQGTGEPLTSLARQSRPSADVSPPTPDCQRAEAIWIALRSRPGGTGDRVGVLSLHYHRTLPNVYNVQALSTCTPRQKIGDTRHKNHSRHSLGSRPTSDRSPPRTPPHPGPACRRGRGRSRSA